MVNNRATEASRGTKTSRWPAEELVAQGDALVTAYCGDIDPDLHDGFTNGVHALYAPPKANEWGSISAWAWGMSQMLDYLETDNDIDAPQVRV